jgi:hypothetical protein
LQNAPLVSHARRRGETALARRGPRDNLLKMRPPLQDFPGRCARRPRRRQRGRAGAAALALGIALLVCHAASATPPAPQSAVAERPDPGAWRGVICTSPSCRPPSRWNAAAFAFAVVTVGWLARRRAAAAS